MGSLSSAQRGAVDSSRTVCACIDRSVATLSPQLLTDPALTTHRDADLSLPRKTLATGARCSIDLATKSNAPAHSADAAVSSLRMHRDDDHDNVRCDKSMR